MAKMTKCSVCGKDIYYNTKKPKRCKECNESVQYNTKKESTRSKLEFKVQTWLQEIFPEPEYHFISNGYYSWIKSPKGYPLQLDFLVYSKHKILFAIEVEGPQHYQKAHYQSQKDYNYLMDCDIIKIRALEKKNINLITLPYRNDMNKGSFIKILKEHGIKEL
jgi:hypothetical protein